MTNTSLFEIQSFCEAKGYKCGMTIETGKARLRLLFNDKLIKEDKHLTDFQDVLTAYEEKYRAIYQYLTTKQ